MGEKPKHSLQSNFDYSLVQSFRRSSLWHCHFDIEKKSGQFTVRDREEEGGYLHDMHQTSE